MSKTNTPERASSFAEGTPTAVIVLDKEREIGFTLGAMRRIREKLGSLEFDAKDPEAVLRSLPGYIWACLDEQGRAELSIERVEDLIHPKNMSRLSEIMGQLFTSSVPTTEGAEGNAVQAEPAPTST